MREDIDEVRAGNRIATDADTGRLAKPASVVCFTAS
jgi:hypothetical protein